MKYMIIFLCASTHRTLSIKQNIKIYFRNNFHCEIYYSRLNYSIQISYCKIRIQINICIDNIRNGFDFIAVKQTLYDQRGFVFHLEM